MMTQLPAWVVDFPELNDPPFRFPAWRTVGYGTTRDEAVADAQHVWEQAWPGYPAPPAWRCERIVDRGPS